MDIDAGSWLGIDVGSKSSKVCTFCLIESGGNGKLHILFERGQVRGRADDLEYPSSNAGLFDDVSNRSTFLSRAAELGVIQILKESELVGKWSSNESERKAVSVDSPCGFAKEGNSKRHTEDCCGSSFVTPCLSKFEHDITDYSINGNHTPLQQRYFWKMIGFAVFRHLVTLTTNKPFDLPFQRLAKICVEGDGIKIRETFPSEIYARANGLRGVLTRPVMKMFRQLVNAEWTEAGNVFNKNSSRPTQQSMDHLHRYQQCLRDALKSIEHGAICCMVKIGGDPSWADLWDAFTCAFVSCCESLGHAEFVGEDRKLLTSEGAILVPSTQKP